MHRVVPSESAAAAAAVERGMKKKIVAAGLGLGRGWVGLRLVTTDDAAMSATIRCKLSYATACHALTNMGGRGVVEWVDAMQCSSSNSHAGRDPLVSLSWAALTVGRLGYCRAIPNLPASYLLSPIDVFKPAPIRAVLALRVLSLASRPHHASQPEEYQTSEVSLRLAVAAGRSCLCPVACHCRYTGGTLALPPSSRRRHLGDGGEAPEPSSGPGLARSRIPPLRPRARQRATCWWCSSFASPASQLAALPPSVFNPPPIERSHNFFPPPCPLPPPHS